MEVIEPKINVTVNDDVSIADLSARMAEGFSVVRSAHVGNMQPYNLTIASEGIPILAVDHTITGVDTNYYPESVLERSNDVQICRLGILSNRAEVVSVPPSIGFGTEEVRFIDQLHIAGVEAAIPDAFIFTNTDYIRDNAAIAGEIIDIAATTMPELFRRSVNPDGQTEADATKAQALARSGQIMQLLDDPRSEVAAALVPNEVDIVINFVVEALKTGRDRIYHLSGPDMVRYIGSLTDRLDGLYATLISRASFGAQLPGELDVQLIPSSKAKFATTMDQRTDLDRLLAAAEEQSAKMAAINTMRRDFFASPQSKDAELRVATVAAFKAAEQETELPVALARDILPELATSAGERGYVTQYDVMAEGGLYVPAVNRELTMAQLNVLDRQISRARGISP